MNLCDISGSLYFMCVYLIVEKFTIYARMAKHVDIEYMQGHM